MNTMSFTLNPVVTTRAVSELRASVGWEPFERDEQHQWDGYWATVGGFDEQGTLIAWCALLSDGQQHGVLLDVMVHPQRFIHSGKNKALGEHWWRWLSIIFGLKGFASFTWCDFPHNVAIWASLYFTSAL